MEPVLDGASVHSQCVDMNNVIRRLGLNAGLHGSSVVSQLKLNLIRSIIYSFVLGYDNNACILG